MSWGLTGESMPISKVAATKDSEAKYGTSHAERHTLYAGTIVLQAGSRATDKVVGLVMRTGMCLFVSVKYKWETDNWWKKIF